MEDIPGLRVLDQKRENRALSTALPDGLQDRWIRLTTAEEEKTGKFPSFSKYAAFVAYEAKISCNKQDSKAKGNQQSVKTGQNAKQNTNKQANNKHPAVILKN